MNELTELEKAERRREQSRLCMQRLREKRKAEGLGEEMNAKNRGYGAAYRKRIKESSEYDQWLEKKKKATRAYIQRAKDNGTYDVILSRKAKTARLRYHASNNQLSSENCN